MIRKLALKPVDNSLNISLNCNITRQESQITIIEQENIYLIPPIEVLQKSPKELEYSLKDLEQYADDLEQYADDLEHYYLEELETYSDSSNINELEELQKQIDEKDDDIRKLTSHINLILEDEYLKDLQQEISEKDACIRNLKSHIDYFYEEYIYIYTTPLRSEIFIGMDIDTMNILKHLLYEEQRKVKHLRGVVRKLNNLMRYR